MASKFMHFFWGFIRMLLFAVIVYGASFLAYLAGNGDEIDYTILTVVGVSVILASMLETKLYHS